MEQIIEQKKCGRIDRFVRVNEFPFGYFVWNIGRHNFPFERCVPLAKQGDIPYHVDLEKLRYIEVKSEKIALKILDEAGSKSVDRDRFLSLSSC